MSRSCDLVVSGGIFFLLLFTPFAFGAVHPWAYSVMESAIFVLIAAAMIKLISLRRAPRSLGPWASRLAIPFVFFGALICFQLLPVPPPLLSLLSPNAYTLYQTTLPGWPEQAPFADLLPTTTPKLIQADLLPTPDQVRQGASLPFAAPNVDVHAGDGVTRANYFNLLPRSWRAVAIAPALTVTDLLKLSAYGAVFFVIAVYPFGAAEPSGKLSAAGALRAETKFLRALFLLLLAAGCAVALVGIVQLFAGNGKILWFFIPHDWHPFSANVRTRASGPFINPDHFANYLALIFPFALSCTLRPPLWFAPAIAPALRIFAGVTAFVIFVALLLSTSRFGWCAALIAIGIIFRLSPRSQIGRHGGNFVEQHRFAFGATIGVALIALSLWFIGPRARQTIDLRLAESISADGTLGSRLSLWQDSFDMIRDFPLLGAGLGAWHELYPRYQRPSASPTFYREAHNDYLQLLAETGLFGFALLGLGVFQCGRMALGAHARAPAHLRALFAPCLAALALMLLHEWFDFSLRIPANALLFTVVLGVTVRLAGGVLCQQQNNIDNDLKPWLPASALTLAIGLIAVTFTQELRLPDDLPAPMSVAAAAARISAHPAQAAGHVALARLSANQVSPSRQSQIYATAAWLHPGDPDFRDLYASALLREGRREQGLKEIGASVALVPSMTRHFYLHERILLWLSADEKGAIEAGFRQAVGRGDFSAPENLARFYERTGQRLAQAEFLAGRAAQATDRSAKMAWTLKAAEGFAAAGDRAQAAELWRQAVTLEPRDARPYQALALSVYAPQGQRERIAAVIAEGIKNNSEPLPLYLSLAQAMQQIGAPDEVKNGLRQASAAITAAAERGENALPLWLKLADTANKIAALDDECFALEQAAALQPAATDTLSRLGNLYLRLQQHDRAAQTLRQLTQLQPEAAQAFFQLAQAEEALYSYAAADAAYSRAAELAPENKDVQGRREEFKQKLAAAVKPDGKK